MARTEQTFQYTDPRGLEGDPYQVANAAAKQALSVGELYATALDDVAIFARNAEMERECAAGDDPDGSAFGSTPVGQKLAKVQSVFAMCQQSLEIVRKAAAYDPKHPPTEDNPL